jgi:hypothetical protein
VFLHLDVCEEQKVEIEGSRAITDGVRPVAAELALDFQQAVQQFPRGKIGLQLDHRVDESGLIGDSDRLRAVER